MKYKWTIKTLSDIADFNPRESLSKGTLAKKIAMDKLQPFCRDVPSFELEKFSGGTKFRNGDTIMARITPCLENGKTAKVNILDDGEIGFGSTEYIVFRAKEGTDKDYLYYLVCSPLVREPAIKSMVGSSGRQRVQTDVVQGLSIAVPPIEEQRQIGGILRALDDKIELNNEINKNLEQQAQAIYQQMFIDNPDPDWIEGSLSDIANITMGQSPSGSSYNEDGIGTIFFQGRAEFGFRFPTIRLYTTEPKRMAYANDILMSVRAPVGNLNVSHNDCCIGRGLAAIHSKTNHQSFVLYTMFSLKKQLDVFNGEGTVFGSINRNSLNDMPILIPDDEQIEKFELIVAPMDATIRNNYDEICRLQAVRDSLLPRLMSGELDVSDIDL
ncbi:restriction endonuclease subunit S [Mageeibacillus indolicus]|uniref:restriction endonuclease subunit S n=1 Tax=Mageeibacillus indolicus TaxID=884684 RepID=UPI0009DD1611|nr:restriction endonuclease subunit S [Mageeibacillus indolicus]